MSTAKWQNIADSKKFFSGRVFNKHNYFFNLSWILLKSKSVRYTWTGFELGSRLAVIRGPGSLQPTMSSVMREPGRRAGGILHTATPSPNLADQLILLGREDYPHLLQFRFSKATKFETISHLIWRLLSKYQIILILESFFLDILILCLLTSTFGHPHPPTSLLTQSRNFILYDNSKKIIPCEISKCKRGSASLAKEEGFCYCCAAASPAKASTLARGRRAPVNSGCTARRGCGAHAAQRPK